MRILYEIYENTYDVTIYENTNCENTLSALLMKIHESLYENL